MGVGRVYQSEITGIAVTTAIEFFHIQCPADSVVFIEEVSITQDTSETSEQLVLQMFRTADDESATGTANTPAPLEVGDPAFGGTVRTNLAAGSSTKTTGLKREGQNVLNGWLWKGSYEEPLAILSPTAGTAGRLTIGLVNAPGASMTFSATLKFREIGG